MNLVAKYSLIQSIELSRQRWTASQRPAWIAEGLRFMRRRMAIGLGRSRVASDMGFGVDTIRKFEEGEPMRRARIVRNIYTIYIAYMELFARTIGDGEPDRERVWQQQPSRMVI